MNLITSRHVTSRHGIAIIDSEDMMDRAVEMIVVCAQMNEHFSFMYADLCRRITDNWSSGTVDDEVNT